MNLNLESGKVFGANNYYIKHGKKVIIHKGGTGSGKTFETMMYLFQLALTEKNLIITVVSESYPHLEIGAIRILSLFCKDIGLWGQSNWNKTKSVWVSPSGTIIEFFSADRIGKALGARRDVLYGNEINFLKKDVWDELARRSEIIIADFNPTSKFWLEDWIADYDCSIIINSNYKDNPFLSETEKNRIEKRAKRDMTFRRVHIDCEYGVAEGLIFTNWKVIKRFPENMNYEFGLDWGFTNDPSTLIKVATDRDCIYCDEIFYSPGLLNKDIVRLFEANDIKKRYDVIIADNSEPKSIEEIYGYNYNILPSQKGADSVRVGIDRIKSKELLVTERSVNMINELENYRWEIDKNGKPTNKPIDAYNHTIDATRYALEPRNDFEYKIA